MLQFTQTIFNQFSPIFTDSIKCHTSNCINVIHSEYAAQIITQFAIRTCDKR